MDEIARAAWQPVYHGKVKYLNTMVDRFFEKYDAHIYKAPASEIEPITWQDLKYACTHGAYTVGGVDGWTKEDLAWISDLGNQCLARFYSQLETTQHWPTSTTTARAVFLSKDTSDAASPMAYRILKITSALYRLWASVRVKNIEKWILQ